MKTTNWQAEFPAAITVTNREGIIVEMNRASTDLFQESGGKNLIGKNIMDCHPDHAQQRIFSIRDTLEPNIYTIQKDGKRKLILQSPHYENGQFNGLVEISIEIPDVIPHYNRDVD